MSPGVSTAAGINLTWCFFPDSRPSSLREAEAEAGKVLSQNGRDVAALLALVECYLASPAGHTSANTLLSRAEDVIPDSLRLKLYRAELELRCSANADPSGPLQRWIESANALASSPDSPWHMPSLLRILAQRKDLPEDLLDTLVTSLTNEPAYESHITSGRRHDDATARRFGVVLCALIGARFGAARALVSASFLEGNGVVKPLDIVVAQAIGFVAQGNYRFAAQAINGSELVSGPRNSPVDSRSRNLAALAIDVVATSTTRGRTPRHLRVLDALRLAAKFGKTVEPIDYAPPAEND